MLYFSRTWVVRRVFLARSWVPARLKNGRPRAFSGHLECHLGVLGALLDVVKFVLGISCAIWEISGWFCGGLWAPLGFKNGRLAGVPCYFWISALMGVCAS